MCVAVRMCVCVRLCVYVSSTFSDIYVQRGVLFAAQCTAKIAYEVRHELHLLLLFICELSALREKSVNYLST